MQVEVIEVVGDGRVVVRSAFGTFTAAWDGDRPAVGSQQAVELDVGGTPVMVDTDGDPPLGVIGRHAVVRARDVTLYPYDL